MLDSYQSLNVWNNLLWRNATIFFEYLSSGLGELFDIRVVPRITVIYLLGFFVEGGT